jgi:hypothetical protein
MYGVKLRPRDRNRSCASDDVALPGVPRRIAFYPYTGGQIMPSDQYRVPLSISVEQPISGADRSAVASGVGCHERAPDASPTPLAGRVMSAPPCDLPKLPGVVRPALSATPGLFGGVALLTETQLRAELMSAIMRAGSAAAFADNAAISRSDVSKIANGHRPVTEAIANALGYFRVSMFQRKGDKAHD